MKEHPILFRGRLVRAILDGRKTVTRRVIKPQPQLSEDTIDEMTQEGASLSHAVDAAWQAGFIDVSCPYGAPGDRLYVRETWAASSFWDGHPPRGIAPDGTPLWYEADGAVVGHPGAVHPSNRGKLRPSIFMPRWASRIELEVTQVRVERVQDISTADIWAEGVQIPTGEEGRTLWRLSGDNPAGRVPLDYLPDDISLHRDDGKRDPVVRDIARAHWADLWDETNYKRGFGWDENPWVWVVRFRRADP